MKKRDQECLKKIALDIYTGKIFTSAHAIHDGLSAVDVFPVIQMLTEAQLKTIHESAELFFEYMDKKIPNAKIPQFLSFEVLNKEEAEIVWKFYDEIKNRRKDNESLLQKKVL